MKSESLEEVEPEKRILAASLLVSEYFRFGLGVSAGNFRF
jgi:hypothetical protein